MNHTRQRLIRELTTVRTIAQPRTAVQLQRQQQQTRCSSTDRPIRYTHSTASCPHMVEALNVGTEGAQTTASSSSSSARNTIRLEDARPYSEVPGPKPLPILGNTWR